MIIKSDQEPAIRKLVEAVKNETAEEIDIEKKTEIIPEKSPVAESRAMERWKGTCRQYKAK